jgi:hypothetical protein
MIKKLISFILALSISFFASLNVLAADFQLTHIGTLATEGESYSQWSYSSPQPTLKGTGTVDASVEVKIDETSASVVVDEDGLWSFTPTEALAEGDHQVVLTSGGSVISFTLTISEEPTESSSEATATAETADSLPVAGSVSYTLVALILGGLAFFLGGFFLLKPKSLFIRK